MSLTTGDHLQQGSPALSPSTPGGVHHKNLMAGRKAIRQHPRHSPGLPCGSSVRRDRYPLPLFRSSVRAHTHSRSHTAEHGTAQHSTPHLPLSIFPKENSHSPCLSLSLSLSDSSSFSFSFPQSASLSLILSLSLS